MTSPAPFGPAPQNRVQRANWLGRYLDVEAGLDNRVKSVLTDALSHVDEAFDSVKENFSGKVRRQQYSAAKRSMRDLLSHVFGVTEDQIKTTRKEAAMAAVDATLYDERGILARIFKDPTNRQQYADSLRQTAARNVENVVARTLFSEKPLSQQVYKTEALANNLVSQAINRSLARGDSAKELAKSVKDMIDPNVKGGISYAAERLGRTELNNAFHATAIKTAQDQPWTQQMEWHLSKVHATDPGDECEMYSQQRFFDIERIPEKPHPNCRCYVTPVNPDYDNFENSLLSGQYDRYLDEQLGLPPEGGRAREEAPFPDGTTDRVRAAYEKARARGETDLYKYMDKSWSPAEKKAAQKLSSRLQSEAIAAEETSRLVEQVELAERSQRRITDDTIPESIDDAQNGAQVANYLQTRYEGLEVINFDYEDVDVRAAKDIATGFVERQRIHPQTNIRSIQIVDNLAEHVNAETHYDYDITGEKVTGEGFSDIVFNHTHVANHDRAVRELKARVKSGFFSKKARIDTERPFYYTAVHEWGHVLDNSGRNELSRSLNALNKESGFAAYGIRKKFPVGPGLNRRWWKQFRDPSFDLQNDSLPKLSAGDIKDYESWIIDNLPSGYSFIDDARKQPHNLEMVAESYLEFMKNKEATSKDHPAYHMVQEMSQIIKRNRDLKVKVSLRD